MSATKEYHSDLIEKYTRQYDILVLQKKNMDELIEIAGTLGATVGQATCKQTLIYAILEKQGEL